MSEVMALLILLKGDVLTLVELERFSDMESCRDFAKMEYPAAVSAGNSGIGCATYNHDGALEMKLIGVMKVAQTMNRVEIKEIERGYMPRGSIDGRRCQRCNAAPVKFLVFHRRWWWITPSAELMCDKCATEVFIRENVKTHY